MQKEFKVWYNNQPATQEQLDAIEEIVVVQEVDLAWEAQIKIPVCIREDGAWHGEDDEAYQQNARVRIEARIGEGRWIPLIDGTIIRQQPDYNASPGMSVVTLIVHDDIRLLGTEPPPDDLHNMSDDDIIRELFNIDTISGPPEIVDFPGNRDHHALNNLSGTRFGMLRQMARRYHGFHAYVLPSDEKGKSNAFFRKFPDLPATELPEMVLTGPGRNISRFHTQQNIGRAARFEGASLNLDDLSVSEGSSRHVDTLPLSGESAASDDPEIRTERLEPGETELTDVQAAAEAAAAESAYTLSADGDVIPHSYSGILRPYMRVEVRLSNSRYSTDYVIRKVTHTLGRSEYTQSFAVLGNAVSPRASTSASVPAPSATAAVGAAAVSFNIQVDII